MLRLELFHRQSCVVFLPVNNTKRWCGESLDFIGWAALFALYSPGDSGEQTVHIN